MKLNIRDLKAEEIDARISQVFDDRGITLLLYKNARVDMDILDECVGPMNWQRHHTRDNANCTIAIWDEDKKEWIEKEDTGTESFSEAEKGKASDSFKRSGFNWGIGRELYTAPFIWIEWNKLKNVTTRKNPKPDQSPYNIKDTFEVKDITIKEKKIVAVTIANNKGEIVFEKKEKK